MTVLEQKTEDVHCSGSDERPRLKNSLKLVSLYDYNLLKQIERMFSRVDVPFSEPEKKI